MHYRPLAYMSAFRVGLFPGILYRPPPIESGLLERIPEVLLTHSLLGALPPFGCMSALVKR
jgi:hypothetical protein